MYYVGKRPLTQFELQFLRNIDPEVIQLPYVAPDNIKLLEGQIVYANNLPFFTIAKLYSIASELLLPSVKVIRVSKHDVRDYDVYSVKLEKGKYKVCKVVNISRLDYLKFRCTDLIR